MLHRRKKQEGQALVEFALAATLIFMLLTAAVDVGLMFFTLQGLHNAAQEGASYGSHPIVDDATGNVRIDNDGIRERVRLEGGDQGIGFANLLDLNSDGTPDDSQPSIVNLEEYITIQVYRDSNGDGTPEGECTNLAQGGFFCFIRVTVKSDYDMLFPFAPSFGNGIPIQSSYTMPIRSTIYQLNP